MKKRCRDWPFLSRIRCAFATAALLCAAVAAGCASDTVETAKSLAFSQVDRLETALKRGVSTKSDVLMLLGEPDGRGGFGGFLEVRGREPARAWSWYYEQRSRTGKEEHQRLGILVIFFEGDTYDGFFWFGVDAAGKAW